MMKNFSHSMRICVKGKLKKEEWTNLKYETYWNKHQGSTLTFPVATDKEKKENCSRIHLYYIQISNQDRWKAKIYHWMAEYN